MQNTIPPIQTPTGNPIVPPNLPPTGQGFGAIMRKNKWAVWLLAISIVIIAVIAIFVFKRPPQSAQPKVSLSIDAPAQIGSSKEVVYRVHIENDDSVGINAIVLNLLYPQGFSFESSVPDAGSTTGNQFNVPVLAPSQNTIIIIKGTMVGNAGENKTITATMHYTYANFNSNFSLQAQATTTVNDSEISLQFTGPSSTNNSEQVSYTLTATNTTNAPLTGLTLKLTLPNNFTLSSYTPVPDIDTTWNLPSLQPNTPVIYQINGNFVNATLGDQPSFAAEVDGVGTDNTTTLFSNTTYPVTIAASPLSVVVALTSAGSNANFNPGDTENFSVKVVNSSQVTQTGVIVSAAVSGDAADTTTLSAANSVITGNSVTWDGSKNSSLTSLGPTQEADFSFNVRIKNPPTRGNTTNITISTAANAKSDQYQQLITSDPFVTKLNTQAAADSSVTYVNGANPPQPGSQTTYMVTINLRNSTNDVTGGLATFNVPNSVSFDLASVDPNDQKEVSYVASIKKLTWNVGTLVAHTGDYNALRTLQFDVTVNPNITDVGQSIALVTNFSFSGTDGFTSNPITLTLPVIQSSNDHSLGSAGSGIVQ